MQTESDSDTAPSPANLDEREETDEEKKVRKMQSVEDSAKLASSEDEALPSQARVRSAKVRSGAGGRRMSEAKEAENPSEEESSEDDQWFAK